MRWALWAGWGGEGDAGADFGMGNVKKVDKENITPQLPFPVGFWEEGTGMEHPQPLMAVAQLQLGNSSPKIQGWRLNTVPGPATLIHSPGIPQGSAWSEASMARQVRAPSHPCVPILGWH